MSFPSQILLVGSFPLVTAAVMVGMTYTWRLQSTCIYGTHGLLALLNLSTRYIKRELTPLKATAMSAHPPSLIRQPQTSSEMPESYPGKIDSCIVAQNHGCWSLF